MDLLPLVRNGTVDGIEAALVEATPGTDEGNIFLSSEHIIDMPGGDYMRMVALTMQQAQDFHPDMRHEVPSYKAVPDQECSPRQTRIAPSIFNKYLASGAARVLLVPLYELERLSN
jgi:hypothetical protein